jgi:hypothetical protein
MAKASYTHIPHQAFPFHLLDEGFCPAKVTTLYDTVFEQFDINHDDTVDQAMFREEMHRVMLAVFEGLGSQPL